MSQWAGGEGGAGANQSASVVGSGPIGSSGGFKGCYGEGGLNSNSARGGVWGAGGEGRWGYWEGSWDPRVWGADGPGERRRAGKYGPGVGGGGADGPGESGGAGVLEWWGGEGLMGLERGGRWVWRGEGQMDLLERLI